MSMILDGKKASMEIKNEIKEKVNLLKADGKTPSLAVILVGDDPASAVYVKNKERACAYTGIRSVTHRLDQNTDQQTLLALIGKLGADPEINGILVQLPLPKHLNEAEILLAIEPSKDVDCFHPYNVGLLYTGRPFFEPCTPAGVIELIKRNGIKVEGENCVVLGRSNIVGKPMGTLLLGENGTVTICHSRTKGLAEITRTADILVVAVGQREMVTGDMIRDGAVVIDVGMHKENGKLFGDVAYESCARKASAITPVPGGVGPMTIAMLMKNCYMAAARGVVN